MPSKPTAQTTDHLFQIFDVHAARYRSPQIKDKSSFESLIECISCLDAKYKANAKASAWSFLSPDYGRLDQVNVIMQTANDIKPNVTNKNAEQSILIVLGAALYRLLRLQEVYAVTSPTNSDLYRALLVQLEIDDIKNPLDALTIVQSLTAYQKFLSHNNQDERYAYISQNKTDFHTKLESLICDWTIKAKPYQECRNIIQFLIDAKTTLGAVSSQACQDFERVFLENELSRTSEINEDMLSDLDESSRKFIILMMGRPALESQTGIENLVREFNESIELWMDFATKGLSSVIDYTFPAQFDTPLLQDALHITMKEEQGSSLTSELIPYSFEALAECIPLFHDLSWQVWKTPNYFQRQVLAAKEHFCQPVISSLNI